MKEAKWNREKGYSSFIWYFLYDLLKNPLGPPLNTYVTSVRGCNQERKKNYTLSSDIPSDWAHWFPWSYRWYISSQRILSAKRIEEEKEEEEDANIKFLWSCSTRHIYVFSSCSVSVEQAMSNIEIVNKRGIPKVTLLKRQVQRAVLDTVCNIRIN